ncbi:MAG TPA: translation initiation factor IF-2, partial [Methylococcaceae bacterium]|nr:translation initiation factor IF-2 [Methylococcaceae bacterium]
MSDKTVRQLAEVVGIPLERLLEQLKEAGLSAHAPDDVINEDEKVKLLAHLRKRHGKSTGEADAAPKRVTLKRRTVSELKQSSAPGSSAKTISIEVRKKKTYVKRTEVATVVDEPKESEEIKKAAEATPAQPMPVSTEHPPVSAVAEEKAVRIEEELFEREEPVVETVTTDDMAVAASEVIDEEALTETQATELRKETERKARLSESERKKEEEKQRRLEAAVEK